MKRCHGKKAYIKAVAGVIVGVTAAFYFGAMYGFFPFFTDDWTIRAIGFCTLVIRVVIVICTCVILEHLKKLK